MASYKRFVLINVVPHVLNRDAALYDLEELKSLVSTFGGSTIVRIIQRKDKPSAGTYVGSGKAAELVEIVKEDKIDVVVINDIVQPSQLFTLKKMIWPANNEIEVWDRIDLILHIFDKHAHTAESKLQIELARMRHMGPRIYGMGNVLSRQGGGIGTRGIGETNTELMKRHWRTAMKEVDAKLKHLERDRAQKMEHRKEQGLRTVSIVGYTNAGKTTLFNALTRKNKKAADVLFATLESSLGKVYIPALKEEILISDTIGFIQKLPPSLIQAFKSTLLESIHADVLLHVIDVSDPLKYEKIEVVENILTELGIGDKKRIYIFNKIDAAPKVDKDHLIKAYAAYSPIFISAQDKDVVSTLEKILAAL